MTIAAAIDLGTNSTKMTVARIGPPAPNNGGVGIDILFDRSEVTRMGKGVDESKRLADDAVERAIAAVERFADEARQAGASTIIAAGTSALRDASNGAEVIAKIKERANVDVQIVDGDREAQLGYMAIAGDASLGFFEADPNTRLLVFDIGGGSTELIVGNAKGIERHQSLNIGAVRLTERFIKNDPPTEGEVAKIEGFALGALQGFGRIDGPITVAGIGGTAVNIAAILNPDVDPHGATVTRADVDALYTKLRGMTLDQRRELRGLEPARADVIIAGAAILGQLLAFVDASDNAVPGGEGRRRVIFRVSTRGLRYGLLAEFADPHS